MLLCMKKIIFLFATSFLVLNVFKANCQYPGQYKDKIKMETKIPLKAYSFNLQDVRLLNSPFKENMERDGKWLLSIDNKRLLHSFRLNAGIRTNAKAYGGWEALDVELRGHTMGHVLSGLAMMYASTGDTAYKNKGDSLVAALAEVQQVINQDGYLSAFPQYYIDRAVAGTGVWAPWYTLHKIFAGMIDMYLYANNAQALNVVNKMSAWAYKKLSVLTPAQLAVMHKTEFGGMNEAFYNLYSITGNADNLKLADMFYHHAVLDPLAQQQDNLNKLHANTQIPKIIGEARGYEMTGDEKDKTIANFFWQTVINNHTYATGGNSENEHFFEPGKLSQHMGVRTTESCNTYNMLKLTRHLFTWSADAKYADYYEQALYNHILATQDSATGMVSYFMPFKPGSFKVYSTRDSSFWCCVGTGFENHAKYTEGIYYHDDKGLYVNLFIPSELTWKEKGIKVKQETKYPEEETTHLTITGNTAVDMPLYIRYPSWATSGAAIKVNGKKISVNQKPGSYITINRKWKNGDKVDITYPMSLRLVATPDNPDKAAIAYGPVALAGSMGTEGIKEPAPFAKDQNDLNRYPVPANIITALNTYGAKISDWLKPVATIPLTFKTTNSVAASDITLMPYYKIDRQRYVLYWDLR
jgi:uncharacterized protein